jgi:hypothetical protein
MRTHGPLQRVLLFQSDVRRIGLTEVPQDWQRTLCVRIAETGEVERRACRAPCTVVHASSSRIKSEVRPIPALVCMSHLRKDGDEEEELA